MKAVIIEPHCNKTTSLITGCPKLMLNIMDKPLIYHMRDYLEDMGIEISALLTGEHTRDFPEEFSPVLQTFESYEKFFFRPDGICEDTVILSRPCISDIKLDISGEGITNLYCSGRDTGIYIISKGTVLNRSSVKRCDVTGYFNPVESKNEYISCHREFLQGRIKLKTESVTENKGVIIGADTLIKIGACINPPVYIGKGTIVESGAKIDAYSVIGSDCIIASQVSTGGSVINKGSFVGEGANLKKALVAPLVRIKKNAVLNELSVVGRASVIGEAVTVCEGVVVGSENYVPDGRKIKGDITERGKIPVFSFCKNTLSAAAGADFDAEDICRLGACFARLNPNLRISVASEESPSALMIKYAFISGIMSAGGEAADLGCIPLYILRFAPSVLKAAAGVYISGNERNQISFYSRDSSPLRLKDMERLKRMFPDGNFARSGASGIKPPLYASNISRLYFEKVSPFFKKIKGGGYVYLKGEGTEAEYIEYLSEKTGITVMDKRKNGCISASVKNKKIEMTDENGRVLTSDEISFLYNKAFDESKGFEAQDDNIFKIFQICGYLLSE